jgi:hypothetical protein
MTEHKCVKRGVTDCTSSVKDQAKLPGALAVEQNMRAKEVSIITYLNGK